MPVKILIDFWIFEKYILSVQISPKHCTQGQMFDSNPSTIQAFSMLRCHSEICLIILLKVISKVKVKNIRKWHFVVENEVYHE